MAEHSYFWPDVNGDREYTDNDLAEFSGGFVTHGVYNGDLAVTAGTNMSIVIPSGRAYVGPSWKVRKYYNDGPLTLAVANADGVLNRKDTVVLRSDINTRSVTAMILTGTFASNPVAPAIVRTAEQYDLKIAEINVPAGTTAITQALITDTRLDSTVCGIVASVMQQVDTTALYNQIQADLASFKSVNEADFTAWVNSLKDVLDAETAGNLLNLINNHKADYPSHVTQLTCTKSGTVYALTGLTATAGVVSCMFKASAAFAAGDTVTINGAAYTLKTIDGTALTAGAWAQGALVHGIVDVDNKVLYVAPSAPVGAIPWLGVMYNPDLNTILTPGLAYIQGCTNGAAQYGFLEIKQSVPNVFMQIFYDYNTNSVYQRRYNSGTWTAWSKSDAGKADYASGSVALATAGLRNAIIIQKTDAIPTGLADGTIVMRYTP